jgi:hypothetical protein
MEARASTIDTAHSYPDSSFTVAAGRTWQEWQEAIK